MEWLITEWETSSERLAVGEQRTQAIQLISTGRLIEPHQMHMARADRLHPGVHRLQARQQLSRAEFAQGVAAVEEMDVHLKNSG